MEALRTMAPALAHDGYELVRRGERRLEFDYGYRPGWVAILVILFGRACSRSSRSTTASPSSSRPGRRRRHAPRRARARAAAVRRGVRAAQRSLVLTAGLALLDLVAELSHDVGVAERRDVTQLAPSAMSRRGAGCMICLERVLGRSAQMIRLGRASLPIRLATCSRISAISLSEPRPSRPGA